MIGEEDLPIVLLHGTVQTMKPDTKTCDTRIDSYEGDVIFVTFIITAKQTQLQQGAKANVCRHRVHMLR